MHGLRAPMPHGFKIPFVAGHTRRMLRLTGGPLPLSALRRSVPQERPSLRPRARQASRHLAFGVEPDVSSKLPFRVTRAKSSSAISSMSTSSRFRSCLAAGAHCVQVDFTEGRLAVKIDPLGDLLHSFVDLNNLALSRFSTEERRRLGVHTCPGGDRDSTHSADIDYADLLPTLLLAARRAQLLYRSRGRARSKAGARDHSRST